MSKQTTPELRERIAKAMAGVRLMNFNEGEPTTFDYERSDAVLAAVTRDHHIIDRSDVAALRHWCVQTIAEIDQAEPRYGLSAAYVAAPTVSRESDDALERYIAAIPQTELDEL